MFSIEVNNFWDYGMHVKLINNISIERINDLKVTMWVNKRGKIFKKID